VAAAWTVAAWACAPAPEAMTAEPDRDERSGGRLVASLRAEPQTFNPVTATDNPSRTVIALTMADLVHTNRLTQESEAALAESWTASPDGRRFTLELRRGLRFSDGHPLDADDVVFSFQVYLDAAIASSHRDLLIVGGEPIEVRKTDAHRLEVELAEPYAVGVQIFDSIAILPEHRLADAYREGRLAQAWGLSTPPEEMAGLGPFQVERYVPGERLELARNPHYWKTDQQGRRLPYLDKVVFLVIPDKEAQTIRFRTGEVDVIERLAADDFSRLEASGAGDYALHDLGPGFDVHFLFFNLNDLEDGGDEDLAARQEWFRSRGFRRAVSLAIDRDAIVKLVYQNRASALASHVTPGNKRWHHRGLPPPRRSLAAARRALEGAGFSLDAGGRLHDAGGRPVRFSIVTNSGNSERVRMATIVQEDLRQLGIEVQIAPLEFRALVDRLTKTFDFEACILGLTVGDDPNQVVNVWHSTGNGRLWRLHRTRPEPPWQLEIDRLMTVQVTEPDGAARKGLYDRVQEILAEQEPCVLLVSPNVLVGARRGLGNFRPAVLEPLTLWNVDELYWQGNDAEDRP
jgi:peptide/nickel transport system substrate-binding protein